MKWNKGYGQFILRLFFGIAFLVAGLDKILSFPMAKGMFIGLFGGIGALLIFVAIAIEILGGLALLFGYHTRYAAAILGVLIFVAFIATFKLGQTSHFVGLLREIMVMNTGGGNTAVNFAYFGALLSLVFTGGGYKAITID